jgi:HSP20 family protein
MLNLIPWKRRHQAGNDGGSLTRSPDRGLLLRDKFDSLMNRAWGGLPAIDDQWFRKGFGWSFDMEERDNAYVVRAEAPGFEAGDFDVDVRGKYLTIRAEHKEEKKEGENGSRYSYGRFERSATLPPGVDAENVSARYRNGVLELQLPKSAESRGKRITVQAS